MSFDWFGNRIAIVSEDQKISIYKQIDNQWIVDHPKWDTGHQGPIWKIKWAHPSFGNIIATCSYDKTVIIWEEKKKNHHLKKTWEKKLILSDFNDSVEDIKFAPSHFDFKLAAVSSDGFASIYDF